jgi:hypothetical protein
MEYVIIGRYAATMVNSYGYFMLMGVNYQEAGFAMDNLDKATKLKCYFLVSKASGQ